jgi:hypothetical protein
MNVISQVKATRRTWFAITCADFDELSRVSAIADVGCCKAMLMRYEKDKTGVTALLR